MKIIILILVGIALTGCGKDIGYLQGPKGDPGLQGASGSNGVGCTVTSVAISVSSPNGGSLISCANSSSLVLNGTTGSNGAAGNPGTVITSKQLCPGTPVYPSTFIEVAFCMNHQLYGVYSIPGSFMTLLPPGAYTSSGINSSCNFNILPDCVVTH